MLRRNKSALAFYALCCILLLPSVSSAETAYQTGTLLGIERKVKITPLAYVFEVAASYYETVTYELQIQMGQETYFADYTPDIQPNWPLPTEWRINRPLKVRADKHRLFVKLSYDGEIVTYIAHRIRAQSP